MRTVTLLLTVTLVTLNCWSQSDFKQRYEKFRFSLHSQLAGSDFKLSRSLEDSMAAFLQQYHAQIIDYRKSQLRIYERAPLHNAEQYRSLEPADLESILSQVVFFDSAVLQSKLAQEGHDLELATTIQSMLGLMSVDPLNKVHLLHNQAMTLVFMEHLQLTATEMADVYGKIGLGGVYLSTEELDANHWMLIYNTYYVLFKYQIDIETGAIKLLDIQTRI